jgi:tRNA G18 (ribose-2'-O)-methylase SpoU
MPNDIPILTQFIIIFVLLCFMLGLFMFIKIADIICSQSNVININDKINVINELQHLELPQLRKLTRQLSLDIHLIILNVQGEINIGMMVRSAMALGVSRVFIIGRKKWDKRTSVGAHHYMDIIYMANLHPYILRDRSVYILEQGGQTLYSLTKEKIKNQRITLIVGNESTGVPHNIQQLGTVISIPQVGIVRSLNVSNACSIALSHFQANILNYVS